MLLAAVEVGGFHLEEGVGGATHYVDDLFAAHAAGWRALAGTLRQAGEGALAAKALRRARAWSPPAAPPG